MRRAGRTFRADWPAPAAWAAAIAVLSVVAIINGNHPFKPATWSRWDAALYQDIAVRGYTLMPCPEQPSDWCGNAGWFPLYPWTIGLLHRVGAPVGTTAAVLAWLSAGGTLVLLWRTFLERSRSVAAVGALLYAAFAPGQVYHYAAFPLSMLAFFTVLHLWALWRGRPVVAGLAGAAAALSYPVGVMVVPISTLWLAADRSTLWRERARRIALASGVPTLGLLLFLAVLEVQTGRWDAYFLVHAKYDHGFRNPLATYWQGLDLLFEGWIGYLESTPGFLTIFLGLVLIAVAVTLVRRRAEFTRLHLLIVIWAVFTFVFPLTQGNLSLPRSEAALLPLAVLVKDLPHPVLIPVVAVAVGLSIPIAALFLQAKIV